MLGADVTLVAPRTLLPPTVDDADERRTSTTLIGDLDVLYLLRMQQERMNEALVPSLREYTIRFGLTAGTGRAACAPMPSSCTRAR